MTDRPAVVPSPAGCDGDATAQHRVGAAINAILRGLFMHSRVLRLLHRLGYDAVGLAELHTEVHLAAKRRRGHLAGFVLQAWMRMGNYCALGTVGAAALGG
jgi:hypothetical protein